VLTDVACSDSNSVGDKANSKATFNVEAGETVTCTFTNTKNGSIVVKKVMVGGTGAFSFTGDVAGSISANEGTLTSPVAPGTYTSVEGAIDGWDLTSIVCSDANSTGDTGTRTATFHLEAGETVTCTFTNTKRATIIVKKTMTGGTDTFSFTGTPNGSISVQNGTIQAVVAPGQYTSTETAVAGWDLTSIQCSDANSSGNTTTGVATFNAEAGETVTCTFTNTKRATIIVKKVMSGGTATFAFTGTPNGSISANNGTISASVAPGQYTSTETPTTGWNLTGLSCDDANSSGVIATGVATFNAEAGETVTCTFTNTAQAKLILAKVCAGADDGLPFTMNVSAGGNTVATAAPTCSASKQVSLAPDTYSVSEVARAGWNAPLNGPLPNGWTAPGQIKCDGSTLNTNSVTLAAGETKTCVVLNVNAACTPAFPPLAQDIPAVTPNSQIMQPAAMPVRTIPQARPIAPVRKR
jgi:hypothetical protein